MANVAKVDSKRSLYLPSFWDDESKVEYLFSEFCKKDLNPISWQEKMDVWIELINNFSSSQKVVVLTARDICSGFEKNKEVPKCIDEVLNYMSRQNNITTVEHYVCCHLPNTWINWSYNVVVKYPAIRLWSFMRNVFSSSPAIQKFVNLDVLKVMAPSILGKLKEFNAAENTDVVFVKDFEKLCVDICEGEHFKFALMQLERENVLKVFKEADNTEVIKFQVNRNGSIHFSNVDRVVLQLRKTITQNSCVMEKLTEKLTTCITAAKMAAKIEYKNEALFHLKKKKRCQGDLMIRNEIQDNLEVMLNKVQSCSSEKMILDACVAATTTLKNVTNALKNLNTDLILHAVADTVDDMNESFEDFMELQEAIAGTLDDDDSLSELEDEYIEMCEEAKEESMESNVGTSEDEQALPKYRKPVSPFTVASGSQ